MVRWAHKLSVRYRAITLIGAVALVLFGAGRLRDAPLGVLPEFSAPIIQIQTEALGLSAAEVEDLVTLNLEELFSGVAWLKTIRSKSITGLSSILLIFEHGTDLIRARQLVQERLNLAHALPNVSRPPVMLQPLSTISRAMIVGLSPKAVSPIDASVLTRWTITPKLLGVPGVANVSTWGLRYRQLQVQIDPERLRQKDISLDEVVEAAGDAMWVSPLSFLEASTLGAGGWIDTPNQRLGIQHIQPIISAGELAKVALKDKPLRLGDVARIIEEHPPLIGDAVIGQEPALLLVIEKFPDANPEAVVRGVDAALQELRQGLPGIDIDAAIFRETSFIDLAIGNIKTSLLIGGGLLIVILVAWFFSWRAVLVSVVAIALPVVVAALVLCLQQHTINILVLTGLAVALISVIDDAVIDTENVMRRLRASRGSGGPMPEVILEALAETRSPMFYATVILVLAAAPLFFVGGPLGAFLSPLAISYALLLVVSAVVAITATPALATLVLRTAPMAGAAHPLGQWLQYRCDALLSRASAATRAALFTAAVVVLAGLAVLPLLSWSLVPSFREKDVLVNWEAPPGISLPEMRRVVTQAMQELRLTPGVDNVAAHIGRAVTGDQVVGVDSAQLWVRIGPATSYQETLAAIREVVQGYPGFDTKVGTYLSDRIKGVLTEESDPVVVRILGPERDVLQREAQSVAKMISDIPGIVDARVEGQVEAPQIEISVDLAAAGRVGLKPGDVRRAVATVFAGLEVGNLFQQQKVFEVVVWGTPEARANLTKLRELLIDTDHGHVRLADVAAVRIMPAPSVIEREGISRRVDIRARVVGRDVGTVLREVRGRLQAVKFPLEYHSALVGGYEERLAVQWRMLIAAFGAAIGAYLLLQASFQSWRSASLLLLSQLMALTGGLFAILLTNVSMSLGAFAGELAVLGLATRNGMSLFDRYRQLREQGEVFGPALVRRGVNERLRPILLSAMATGAVLLPLAIFGDIAGLEILHPMAIVVLGGQLVSALTNLFVLPALYLGFAQTQPSVQSAYSGEHHAQ